MTRKRESRPRALNSNVTKTKAVKDQSNEDTFEETKIIVSKSLFGDEKSRSSRRSSVNSDINVALKLMIDKPVEKSPKKQVLVPNWRSVLLKPTYKLEGTENLNDDFYLKRHQKHENEEKLIKKRDLRRQRDEYLKFKMLNKMKNTNTNKNNKTKSPTKFTIEDGANEEITIKNEDEINLDG